MRKIIHFVIPALVIVFILTSCKAPEILLKKETSIDTLHLELDLRIVQNYEYKMELLKKTAKFVDVYNNETHPFKLSLNSGVKTTSCQIKVIRVKFIHTKQNVISTVVSAAGIGTAAVLIATGFPVPFGWVYIPSARTTIKPLLSDDITSADKFQNIGITSVGMYRSMNKQMDKQSIKFVKYIVSVVQTIEQEYKANK